jgi:tetratricopeptide (TPR) repeat protein
MKIDLESVPESQRGELEKAYAPYLETIAQQKDEENLKQVCKEISSILFSRDWQKRIRQIREQLNARQLEGEIIPIGSLFSEAGGLNAMNIISSIQSLARSGNFRTAIEELYYTLQFMPTYLPLHILLGDLLLEHGFTEDAFTKLFIVAKTYDVRGEKEKALELYRRLTDISPMNTLVRQKLIDLLSEKGEVNECLQEYLNLAEAFYTLADLRQARETYEKAYQYVLQNNLGKNMQVMVLHLIGDLDIQNLDWKSALEIYQQIRELEPNDEKARILTMELNYRLHNLAQALKDLDAYLDFLEQNNKLVQAHNFLKQLELDYPDWKDLPSRTTRIANKLNKGK